ncbi:MAG TPA: bifunctional RNase H/acid phosphatase [Mycobacteriales bacterium]|nr:bifunctional RNase H/acid phosphatase [Mycobacteriales bacterium]
MTAGRRLVVEADGGSRGNPGPAGYGAVVRDADTGAVLAERAGALGSTTNNVAEYSGLLAGLRAAAELAPASVLVRMDSKLVVEQMSGRWKVKHDGLKPLAREAAALVRALPRVSFEWIPRARNGHADRLANEAMDAAARGQEWRPGSTVDGPAQPNPARPGPARPSPARPGPARSDPARPGRGRPDPAAPAGPGWSAPPTATPTRMLLLRHGETACTAERRFSGRGDVPLTERGETQARAAAKRLAAFPDVAAVATSPLARARDTARLVAEQAGAPLVIDDGLVEADFGDWEGLTFAEAQDRWPVELGAWLGSVDAAPPGGESFAAVARRVRRSRDRLIAGYPGRTVALVSHVTPIKMLLRLGLDAGPSVLYRLHLDVAGLSIVDWYADGPASVRLVNDTSHLG